MGLFRLKVFTYLLPLYLVYSTVGSFTIYNLGEYVDITIVLFLCVWGILIRPRIIKNTPQCNIFFLGWALVFLMSTVINSARPGMPIIKNFVFCLFFLYLDVDVQKEVLKKYVRFLSILVLLSALEYILYNITGKGIILAKVTRTTTYQTTTFDHLVFNIVIHALVPRFQGLFKEPGNMGTTCAFMLFVTWKIKSMRFPFIIFLIGGLLSLSLGFYVFLFAFLVTNVKPTKKNVVGFAILMLPLFFVFKDSFTNRIVERVDQAENVEDIDNRTSRELEKAFNKSFESGELWLGVGIANIPKTLLDSGGSAGAKKWIYQYGIIGFIIIFLVYNAVYFQRCGKRLHYNDWVFLMVYWACFYKSVVFMTPSLFVIYAVMPILNQLVEEENSQVEVL